jgi:hypothetical protein
MTTTHASDAAERQYRRVRDLERDTGEWEVRHARQAEPGHSPPSSRIRFGGGFARGSEQDSQVLPRIDEMAITPGMTPNPPGEPT